LNKIVKALTLLMLFMLPRTPFAEELPKNIVGKDGAEMAIIPGGTFIMGSKEEDLKDVAPEHNVYVKSFYMDKYEVTNGQFARFLNDMRPSEEKNGQRWQWVVLRSDLDLEERATWWPTEILYEKGNYVAFEGYENLPVITVSWFAAQAYCFWAGKRLPTEAEWEKAARGGLKNKVYPWGNAIPTAEIIFGRKWRDNQIPPPSAKVGNYIPNGYGLFDMAGNVWEWCYDWYGPTYYKESPKKNPKGPSSGDMKVLRGGSWYNSSFSLRVALRNLSAPFMLNDAVGFRCAKDATQEKNG
jgi:formylglycine-generating enzyme required for sulfatase activity